MSFPTPSRVKEIFQRLRFASKLTNRELRQVMLSELSTSQLEFFYFLVHKRGTETKEAFKTVSKLSDRDIDLYRRN